MLCTFSEASKLLGYKSRSTLYQLKEKGLIDNSANKQAITPYDLRHTYAIRLATDPRCSHISIEEAAQAMGHDIATHKKHYQYWISSEEKKKQIMFATSIPE